MSKNDIRKHTYTFILYPDDCVSNWQSLLGEMMVPCLVSPLHDRDLNADGEPKKPHHHILLDFGQNKKSWEQVEDMISSLGSGAVLAPIIFEKGCPACKSWVITKRSAVRYFVHADNPEKAQYSPSDCICYGGFDFWANYNASTNRYEVIRSILQFCRDNGIESFADLLDYCIEYNEAWYMCLCDSGVYLIKEYMKSRSWDRSRALRACMKQPVDSDKGGIE